MFRAPAAPLVALVLGVLASLAGGAPNKDEQREKELEKRIATATCPVSGDKVKKEFHTLYKGAKLFFSSADTLQTYQSQPGHYYEKANLQLLATKQAKQTACPLTGRPLNPKATTNIGGQAVQFCCANCARMTGQAALGEQLKFVFGAKTFDRQFRIEPMK